MTATAALASPKMSYTNIIYRAAGHKCCCRRCCCARCCCCCCCCWTQMLECRYVPCWCLATALAAAVSGASSKPPAQLAPWYLDLRFRCCLFLGASQLARPAFALYSVRTRRERTLDVQACVHADKVLSK